MPKDKRFGKKWRWRDRYIGRYWQHPGELVPGLKPCRLAAALSERDLADLVGTSRTTINDLESPLRRIKAHPYIIEQLCQVLKVWREDLTNPEAIENMTALDEPGGQTESGAEEDKAERRREVNRIKNQQWRWYLRKSVPLGGLKARRLEAGLSQRELAQMVGTNQTTIHQLEKKYASRGAYMQTIRKLAEVLEVRPVDLICSDLVKKSRQTFGAAPNPSLGPSAESLRTSSESSHHAAGSG